MCPFSGLLKYFHVSYLLKSKRILFDLLVGYLMVGSLFKKQTNEKSIRIKVKENAFTLNFESQFLITSLTVFKHFYGLFLSTSY